MTDGKKADVRRKQAGLRAAQEAAHRRMACEVSRATSPKETGGREGLDPTRYGDWEKAGLISDF